jgi:hypothetical protein
MGNARYAKADVSLERDKLNRTIAVNSTAHAHGHTPVRFVTQVLHGSLNTGCSPPPKHKPAHET